MSSGEDLKTRGKETQASKGTYLVTLKQLWGKSVFLRKMKELANTTSLGVQAQTHPVLLPVRTAPSPSPLQAVDLRLLSPFQNLHVPWAHPPCPTYHFAEGSRPNIGKVPNGGCHPGMWLNKHSSPDTQFSALPITSSCLPGAYSWVCK